MTFYFIETIVDGSCCPDRIGTDFPAAQDATKAALSALLDIVQDESELRTDMEVTVVLTDFVGDPVFSATLLAARRHNSRIRCETSLRIACPRFGIADTTDEKHPPSHQVNKVSI